MLRQIFLIIIILIFSLINCAPSRYVIIEIEGTIEELRSEVINNPNDEIAHYNLGSKYLTLEKPDSALIHFKKAYAINPIFSEAYYGEYCSIIMKNNYSYPENEKELENLIFLFDKAWEYNPLMEWKLGCTLIRIEDPDMMVATTRTEEYFRGFQVSFVETFVKPSIDFFLSDFESSLSGFENLSQIIPNCYNCDFFIAMNYAKMGKYENAIKYINKAINKVMQIREKHFLGYIIESYGLYFFKAFLYEKCEDYNMAIKYYQKAYIEGCINYIVFYKLANMYHNIGNLEKEQEELEQAILMEPDDGICNYNLGFLYMRKGERSKAIEQFYNAIEKSPDFPKSYYHLAVLYEAQEKNDKAVRYYKKFISKASVIKFQEQINTANLKINKLTQ